MDDHLNTEHLTRLLDATPVTITVRIERRLKRALIATARERGVPQRALIEQALDEFFATDRAVSNERSAQ